MPRLTLPPTRTHAQLAAWINAHTLALRSFPTRRVGAVTAASMSDTDRKVGRLRWPGKGRTGTELRIYTLGLPFSVGTPALYRHDTSQTYRRHAEARAWVTTNLTYLEK